MVASNATHVDADVENGEPGVSAGVVVLVELTYDGRNVGLEIAIANNQGTHSNEQEHFISAQNQKLPHMAMNTAPSKMAYR